MPTRSLGRTRAPYRLRLRTPPLICPLASAPCSFGHLCPCTEDSTMTMTSPIRPTTTNRLCHVRMISLVMIDRARAPHVRHTSPSPYFEVFYCFKYFPYLSPPPSGPSLGQLRGRLEWIEIVVRSVEVIIKLPSTTQGPSPARTWTWRTPRQTLLGTPPGSLKTRCGKAMLVGIGRSFHHRRSP